MAAWPPATTNDVNIAGTWVTGISNFSVVEFDRSPGFDQWNGPVLKFDIGAVTYWVPVSAIEGVRG